MQHKNKKENPVFIYLLLHMKTIIKQIIITVLIITLPAYLFAQDDKPELTNLVKISPVRLFDPVNPGLELCYEKMHTSRFSSQLSVAYLKSFFNLLAFDDYRGFRISFEEKYYRKSESRVRSYLSGELIYLNVKHTYGTYYVKDTALMTPQYYDSFKVAKQTLSLNIKSGIQIPVKRFVLEFNAGLGVKYKMVKRTEVEDIHAYEVSSRHPNAYFIASKAGNYFDLSVPVNITIGYRF